MRIRLVGFWLVGVVCLAAVGGASAAPLGTFATVQRLAAENVIGRSGEVAMSSGAGAFVYAAAQAAVRTFIRNPLDGTLLLLATDSPLDGAEPAALSADGGQLYVGAANAVLTYARDQMRGALALVQTAPADQLGTDFEPVAVVPSPDGAHVYVAGQGGSLTPDGVIVYARDLLLGTLTFVQAIDAEALTPSMRGLAALAISPDGDHLYLGGETFGLTDEVLVAFARNPTTGELTVVDVEVDDLGPNFLGEPLAVLVTPDGAQVLVGTDDLSISVFDRNTLTGEVTFASLQPATVPASIDKFVRSVASLVISPDGTRLWACGRADALVGFDRAPGTGALTATDIGILRNCHTLLRSPDGAFFYASEDTRFTTVLRPVSFGCAPAPLGGCKTTVRSGRSSLKIAIGSTASRTKLDWKWKGQATTLAEFGDPGATANDYALCVYDGSADPQPVVELLVPAGPAQCGDHACWEATPRRIKYIGNGVPHGVQKLILSAGIDNRASVKLLAMDILFQPPALPRTVPLTVQLQAASGACWTATASAALRNDAITLRTRSD